MQKKFSYNNQSFLCLHCKSSVPQHPTSSRDHCNKCLYGLHVDIFPGDRENECKGVLTPIGLKITNGKEKILYECEKCNKKVWCIVAPDDNREEILRLSTKIYTE